MTLDEDEENALLAAIMSVVGVIMVFWMESLLVVLTMTTAISELILWPALAVILLIIAWKLSD